MKKQKIVKSLLILIIFFFGLNIILNFNLILQYSSNIKNSLNQDVKTSNVAWTHPIVISDNQNGTINWNTGSSNTPAIAADDSGNIHVVWTDQTNLDGCNSSDSDVFYAKYSASAGQWSDTTVISDNEPFFTNWNSNASSNPPIAVDNSGNIYVVWEDYTNLYTCGYDSDIFYRKYSTSTANWTQPSVVSDNHNGTIGWNTGESSEPAIAVDNSGNVHVVWVDKTNLEGCGNYYEIFYANYSENTEQWSHSFVISDNVNGTINWNTGYSYDPSIDVDDSGNVHVVWSDDTNLEGCETDSDIFYVKYSPSTGQWSHAAVISDNVNGSINWNNEDSLDPSIELDKSGNIYVVWDDRTDLEGCYTDTDIFYRKYSTNIAQWSPVSVISDNEDGEINWNLGSSESPVISVDNSDNINVAWIDSTDLEGCDAGDTDIFYRRYSYSTGTWSQTTVISDNTNGTKNWNTEGSEHTAIDVDSSGNVHIVWGDSTNLEGCSSDSDIFFVKAVFETSSEGGPLIPGFSLNIIIPLVGITLIIIVYKYKRKT